MDLDRLQVVLRHRGVHESMDLGLRIHQRWSAPVYRAWFATVVPAWLVILGVTGALDALWLGLLVVWWLKPMWDRIPLFVVSRAIFGATPTLREVFGSLRSLWTQGLLADLTWYRFSPSRAMLMPVGQLEGLSGRRGAARRQVLGRGTELGGALGLLFAGLSLEFIVATGFLGLVLMMLPDGPGLDIEAIFDAIDTGTGPLWARLVPVVGWLGAITVIEPVYVASGFALYLNRRTALEGWDVELSFRRLAARIATRARIAGAVFLAVALASGGPARASTDVPQSIPVEADTLADDEVALEPTVDLVDVDPGAIDLQPGPAPDEAEAAETAAEAVFDRREFGYDREIAQWEPKPVPTFAGIDLTAVQEWMEWVASWSLADWLDDWLEGWLDQPGDETEDDTSAGWFGDGVSNILEVVLWGVVAAMVVGGAVLLWRRRDELARTPRLPRLDPTPEPVAVGTLRGPRTVEAPAATVPDQVWAAWTHGDPDGALALLYNAALAELAHGRELELDDAWTEGDCARAVRAQVGGSPARYFLRVVRARQKISYAHRPPEDHEVRGLCDDWAKLAEVP